MKPRYILPSIAVLALLAATGLWLRDTAAPFRPNVIFLTVESWRAETATPERMPNLFRAAVDGTRFTRHRAISAWTAPNIIAILTGLPPIEQGVQARGHSVAADRRTFLDELAADGWHVAGLQSFMTIDVFRNLGLELAPGTPLQPWLAARAQARQPFVLWYHYLGTHLPYAPAAAYRRAYEALLPTLDAAARERLATVQSAPAIPAGTVAFDPSDEPAVRALYLGGVAEFDDWFAGFWDFFNRSGLRDSTILVVTADHGEELLERGLVGHASTTRAGHLREEILRIPMFVWLPSRLVARPPASVDSVSDHTDVVPALRAWLGRGEVGRATGLLGAGRPGPYVAETSFGGYAEPDPALPSGFEIAVLDGEWKLRLRQAAGRPAVAQLYNLTDDPGESVDLADREPARVRALADGVRDDLAELWRPRVATTVGPAAAVATRPVWIMPAVDRPVRYADIAAGARLEWTGDPDGRYLVEYRAGEGALAIDGAMEVTGTVKDFGRVDEAYWRTWVVPYGRVRLRVVPASRPDLAGPWLEIGLQP